MRSTPPVSGTFSPRAGWRHWLRGGSTKCTCSGPATPDYWEDISGCIEARIAALSRHASQVGQDVEKLAERIRKSAQEVGEKPGYAFAEGFKRFQF